MSHTVYPRRLVRRSRLLWGVFTALAVLGAATAVSVPSNPRAAASGSSTPAFRLTSTTTSSGAINDLARTPYQGWNTYYGLGSSFNEQTIKNEADALVDRGLARAGYNYVWLDGGWWRGTRDGDGAITVDPKQWPDGMKAVADYIHSKGLKAGIYTDAGSDGCGGAHQGSLGHYQQDADTFAAWGFDAVKVDFCGGEKLHLDPATQYGQFRDALLANSSHRPMLFNICNPFVPETGAQPGKSAYDSWTFGPTTGNSWRTDTDIGFVRNVHYRDVLRNLDDDAKHPEAAGPGHWNDPDYLAPELGLTPAEAQTQFSMWSIVAAPLIIGSDARSISQHTVDMLTNPEVLAIDQDPLGQQGTPISTTGDTQVWVKALADGSRAIALFNRGDTAATVSTTAEAAGLRKAGAYRVRDVWAHTTRESGGGISAAVAPHSVVLLRVSSGIDPETAAPLVTLSPVTSPPAYDGSQLRLAVPGKAFTVTSALENDGRLPIGSANVRLEVPDGWQVSPAATAQVGQLPGGGREGLSWTVTPASDAAPGVVPLTVVAGYTWTSSDTVHSVETTSAASVQVPPPAPSGRADLAHTPWLRATSGWMTPRVDGEVGGGPLRMNGYTYPTGLGVASPSQIEFYVGGQCATVTATVGIDDATRFDPSGGTATFQVLADGATRYDSGTVARPVTKTVTADVSGAQVVTLQVGDAGDGGYNDRADWADVSAQCN